MGVDRLGFSRGNLVPTVIISDLSGGILALTCVGRRDLGVSVRGRLAYFCDHSHRRL